MEDFAAWMDAIVIVAISLALVCIFAIAKLNQTGGQSRQRNSSKRSDGMTDPEAIMPSMMKSRSRQFRGGSEAHLGQDVLRSPGVDFRKLNLLNKAEARLHRQILEHIRRKDHRHLQVFPQVAVSAVIQIDAPDSRQKLAAMNKITSKRFDFVIADKAAKAVMAIEYNGTGHYRSNWKHRDDVKAAACELAGLPLLVVKAPDTFEEVRGEFDRIVRNDQDHSRYSRL